MGQVLEVGGKIGSEMRKEAGVPGFRELVPALRVGPARGADSGRVAPPMPPARSARGFRPTAPAAPRTRRAAGVTGGGGRGEPGGLGVRSPGGRAAGVRAVAPAFALSLLSILHLKRQTGPHPRFWTPTSPPETWTRVPHCPFAASPPIYTQTSASASIRSAPTHLHPLASPTAPCCPHVPPPTAFPQSEEALPAPARRLPRLSSNSGPISTPLPLAPSGTQTSSLESRELPRAPDVGDRSARPGLPASPQRPPPASSRDACTCREAERPRCPRTGSGRQRAASRARPLPQPGLARAQPLHLLASHSPPPPASGRSSQGRLGWGPGRSDAVAASGEEARGGGCRLRRRGSRACPAPWPRAGEPGARARSGPGSAAGGSAPRGMGEKGALERGMASPRSEGSLFPQLRLRNPESQRLGLGEQIPGVLHCPPQHIHLPRPPPQPPGDQGPPGRG